MQMLDSTELGGVACTFAALILKTGYYPSVLLHNYGTLGCYPAYLTLNYWLASKSLDIENNSLDPEQSVYQN